MYWNEVTVVAQRKHDPIRTESFIKVRGIEYNLADLTPDQRKYVAGVLKTRGLNAMFAGKAGFKVDLPDIQLVFPDKKNDD